VARSWEIEPLESSQASDDWRMPAVPSSYLHVTFPHLRVPALVRGLQRIEREDPQVALDPDRERFLEWLFARAGLEWRAYRSETLTRRLPACLRMLRASSPRLARRRVEARPELLEPALASILVGVTSFFRDGAVFEAIADEIAALRNLQRGLYVWSIGCSTGAELYSLALLLARHDGLLERSFLMGTDCRSAAIERARSGRFSRGEVEALAPTLRERWFARCESGWEVASELRRSLQWRVSDILRAHEAGVWDIILFRNVSMYMQAEVTEPLWERLERSLRPGGILVLGRAERPVGTQRLAPVSSCVWRRTVRPSLHFEGQ
jgi:chemotaxis protein methyltransferase CheR